ncbi:cytosine-specific methyltransferase [Sphingobium jiangsuense]|uniref:Cytosine-specific methyltransferase n=1 Tax=Sphingobium jiangsuense TaxID=870476 RepID=A0A7W6BLD4_9SPHN|nr:DNA cytosine methyltransferase [Sphingobium jiangsuense]MBB3928009.1 DNA (cytosine-5)-methyltransferase 1 [Sphingobium jiangsuense]GLT02141.1 cytosine-specific methyltransferase [Sphingobium jiangsuense]
MKAVSLFSGAGGMDVGFRRAGFEILWANDFDKAAVETYRRNIGDHITLGDINGYIPDLAEFTGVDCLFGGPPCQGFSVAGKMALDDPRSQLVKSFLRAVEVVKPRAFVMENVKALGTLSKFKQVRDELRAYADRLGYDTELVIFNAKNFGVPQARERVFFVGFRDVARIDFDRRAKRFFKPEVTTLQAIKHLGGEGTERNPKTCNAVVTIAERPVLRKSPYAGMMFNGLGRPLNPNAPCATLPASMGGNKTPIIDERQFYGDGESWVETYHAHLMRGGAPYGMRDTPSYIRRLTLEEARILHTFPEGYDFAGGKSATYRQIGNAVPCDLAFAVAQTAIAVLNGDQVHETATPQLALELASAGRRKAA